jgi:carbon starvation protein CstA
MIALLFTSEDCKDKEGLNHAILIVQILMVGLLWTGDWFGCRYWKISYLVWAWLLLYAVSSILLAVRFKGKAKKLMNAFLIGNAILLVLAIAQNQTKCNFFAVTKENKDQWKAEVLKYGQASKYGNYQAQHEEARRLEKLLRNHGEGKWVDEHGLEI